MNTLKKCGVVTLIVIILLTLSLIVWRLRGVLPDYRYDKNYKEVFDSYLPDGYEMSRVLTKTNQKYQSNNKGYTHYYNKFAYYYYAKYTDNSGGRSNDVCVSISPFDAVNHGSEDAAVANAINYSLNTSFSRFVSNTVLRGKSDPKGCTTLIRFQSKATVGDTLSNKYNLNLANITWEDYSRVPATVEVILRYSSSSELTEVELEEYCKSVADGIGKESGGKIRAEYRIEAKQ